MPFPHSPSFAGAASGAPLTLNPSVGSDGPRQYSAGYISTAHYHIDHSQSMNAIGQKTSLADQDDWVSSPISSNRIRSGAGQGSSSQSPYRGSGGGLFAFKDSTPLKSSRNSGLFGSTNKVPNSIKSKRINDAMEDDAPPKESLLDEEASNSKASRHGLSAHRSLASSLTTHAANQASNESAPDRPSQTSSSAGYKVHVFGFTPSQQSFVMEHFSSIGELVCPPELSSEGGNWATVTYKHITAAQRAVRKNGEILGGIIMIGCKFVDSSCSPVEARDARAGSEQRNQLGAAAAGLPRSSSMIVSRSLKTYDSTEAFATPAQSNEKGLLGMISNAGKPNPSIFQTQAEATKDDAKSSYINRALDLVFGW